jgi:hypothetical protein
MSEFSTQLSTYKVYYICDSCSIGNLEILPSQGPLGLYLYSCPNCNEQMTSNILYPYIEYK